MKWPSKFMSGFFTKYRGSGHMHSYASARDESQLSRRKRWKILPGQRYSEIELT